MNSFALEEIEQDLDTARARLDAFERSRTSADHLGRLKKASPLHPVLVFRAASGFVSAAAGLGALAALVVPYISLDVANNLSRLDQALGFPLFVAGLAVCFCALLMATAGHFMAISIGRDRPLLPAEARTHQRLFSDVKQLEARKRTSTPAPARPRVAR